MQNQSNSQITVDTQLKTALIQRIQLIPPLESVI